MIEPPANSFASRRFSTSRHTTHYLEVGPPDGRLMIFLHGWPSIALMWRAQMEAFAGAGWRCVAPDLRGFGDSSAPTTESSYTNEEVVADLAELHDHLGALPAVWVGHDWGSAVAAALAAHHPARCRALVLCSLAYQPEAHALPVVVPVVNRQIYPAHLYPDGQWDYYRYYATNFAGAVADLEAELASSLASIFRRGDPAAIGTPSPNASVTRRGGRFGDAHRAPPTQPDPTIWPQADFESLVDAFHTTGFRPSCAWYLNDEANMVFARLAQNEGCLSQPVLFINGDYDQICTVTGNCMGEKMRAACPQLTEVSLPGGHWLPLELKTEVTAAIRTWLPTAVA